jgi:hypothetical protein
VLRVAEQSDVYVFDAPLWRWAARPAWLFVALPQEPSDEIADRAEAAPRRGFGAVKVSVRIGGSSWRTSIFPSEDSYVLPVKKSVRDKENVDADDVVTVQLTVLLDG